MTAIDARSGGAADGFALLVLLGVVGVGSLGVLLAVQALVPSRRDLQHTAEQRLEAVALAANQAYLSSGAYPSDLDALASQVGLQADAGWRRDPYGNGLDLEFRPSGGVLLLRSRGADGRLGTADDIRLALDVETRRRVRERLRLRLLRAVLLRSPYRFADTMTSAEIEQLRDASRTCAVARRRWRGAGAAERVVLAADMAAATATVTALCSLHGLLPLPSTLIGAGGLMGRLGMPDARCNDGCGADLVPDPVLGWVAVGTDGIGGTDDDM